MLRRLLIPILALFVLVAPVAAQTECANPPILTQGRHGTMLVNADVHESAGFASPTNGTLEAGAMIQALDAPPQCVDGTWWWQVSDGQDVWGGWLPEIVASQAVVEPFAFQPATPIAVDVPMQPPVMTTPDVPLPTVNPATMPTTLDVPFAAWDWATATRAAYPKAPDPLTMQLPDHYAGDLPAPPVDLSSVYFVQDAGLNADQLALLAQNGFVVVPGRYPQFDDALRAIGRNLTPGKPSSSRPTRCCTRCT